MAIYHLTTNIAGLMRNCKELQALLDKGDRLLPSDNCKHFDPQEGCKCRYFESDGK